jgi:hypothetical protein
MFKLAGLNQCLCLFIIFVGTNIGLFSSSVIALEKLNPALTADQILEKSDYVRGANLDGLSMVSQVSSYDDGELSMQYKMTIESARGNSLITFVEPARSKGILMLIKERNMWFISPDVRKPVPISPRQRLLGDANNGDIATSNYSRDYQAESIGEELIAGSLCYVLDLKAKSTQVTYDRIKYYVDKESFLGVKAEFYSVSGKILKSAHMTYGNKIQSGEHHFYYVSEMVIENSLKKNDKTVLNYTDIEIKDIAERKFNIRLTSQ